MLNSGTQQWCIGMVVLLTSAVLYINQPSISNTQDLNGQGDLWPFGPVAFGFVVKPFKDTPPPKSPTLKPCHLQVVPG